jgi:hypothetical protein
MKKIILIFAVTLSCIAYGQNNIPSSKLKAAYSREEIASFTDEAIADLNLRGDKLCWFEDVKPGAEYGSFQLYTRNGTPAQLSSSELLSFNPLLYRIPQSERACENLMITTSDGASKLLIVRSVEMMQKEKERAKNQMK